MHSLNSLKARLMKVLFIVAVLFWCGVVGFWISHSMREESGHHDTLFQTTAGQILLSLPADVEQMAGTPRSLPENPAMVEPEKLSFQVWVNQTRAVIRSPAAPLTPLKPDFVNGFANRSEGGEMWRVYSIGNAAGRVHVQVGAIHSVIDSEIKGKVLKALLAASVLLVLLGLAMWSIICWSLRPVAEIEEALRQKDIFDLTPLPAHHLPAEIRPLVVAFNALLARLRESMEGERRFIADAAHELRTPLAALQAHVEVALRAGSIAEKDEAMTKLLAVVERSARLSEQLLDLAQLEAGARAGNLQPIDLCDLIPVVVRDFETIATQREQTISVHAEPCLIDGDIDPLGILLRNLVDNALRYSPQHGHVTITCGVMLGDGVQHAFLRVADDGPGVAKSEQAHIFDRFYRVPGNGGRGSGIGLSLVARIAEFHHAQIDIDEGLDGRGLGMTVVFNGPKAKT